MLDAAGACHRLSQRSEQAVNLNGSRFITDFSGENRRDLISPCDVMIEGTDGSIASWTAFG